MWLFTDSNGFSQTATRAADKRVRSKGGDADGSKRSYPEWGTPVGRVGWIGSVGQGKGEAKHIQPPAQHPALAYQSHAQWQTRWPAQLSHSVTQQLPRPPKPNGEMNANMMMVGNPGNNLVMEVPEPVMIGPLAEDSQWYLIIYSIYLDFSLLTWEMLRSIT